MSTYVNMRCNLAYLENINLSNGRHVFEHISKTFYNYHVWIFPAALFSICFGEKYASVPPALTTILFSAGVFRQASWGLDSLRQIQCHRDWQCESFRGLEDARIKVRCILLSFSAFFVNWCKCFIDKMVNKRKRY